MIIVKKDVFGVGSNFLRLLDWLWYAKYSKDKVYIDWTINGKDLLSNIFDYSNPTLENGSKSYNHYVMKFGKELDTNAINCRKKDIPFYDKYGVPSIGLKTGYFYTTPEVYFENNFHLLRKTFNEIYKSRFTLKESFEKQLIKKEEKTLGVHVRSMQHYCSGMHNGKCPFTDSQDFFNTCAKFANEVFKDGGFKKIYVACDINDFQDAISKFFKPEQILKINYSRLNGNMDWGEGNRDIDDIVYNAFLDIFNLSRCDKLICSVSNLTLTSLIVEPNVEFEFFPNLKKLHGM